jgi:cytochrome P450
MKIQLPLSTVIFFFAGSDTSSVTISYAMLELGQHLEIQEKLRLEIIERTKSTNGEITYENLHEMTYLNQVVNGESSEVV